MVYMMSKVRSLLRLFDLYLLPTTTSVLTDFIIFDSFYSFKEFFATLKELYFLDSLLLLISLFFFSKGSSIQPIIDYHSFLV
jgi:hypothetical protein